MTEQQLEQMRRATDGIGRGLAIPQIGGRRKDDLPPNGQTIEPNAGLLAAQRGGGADRGEG